MTNPFPPNASQVDMLAIILDAMPASHVKQLAAPVVPIQPKMRRPWAEQLVRRGVRVHVEEMEELPVPSTVQGGMSWLTPSKWLPREEYEKHVAEMARPAADQIAEFRERVRAFDPQLVERMEAMTDDERRAAMEQQLQHLAQAAEYVERIRSEVNKSGKESE